VPNSSGGTIWGVYELNLYLSLAMWFFKVTNQILPPSRSVGTLPFFYLNHSPSWNITSGDHPLRPLFFHYATTLFMPSCLHAFMPLCLYAFAAAPRSKRFAG
jgi:hypothetical protein